MPEARQQLAKDSKHVQAFSNDEDYETLEDGSIDEEVSYVTLDLGPIEPTLVPSSSEYRLIGLDTPTPYLQLSGTIFKGAHKTLLGTELLFSEPKDDHQPYGPRESKPSLTHVGITEQRIKFKDVQLKPSLLVQENQIQEATVENVTLGSSGSFSYAQLVGNHSSSTPNASGRGRGRGGRSRKSVTSHPPEPNQVAQEAQTIESHVFAENSTGGLQCGSVDFGTPRMDVDDS